MKVLACLMMIHSWYPPACCSEKDCRPVPCEDIVQGDDGSFVYGGMKFSSTMVQLSPNKECHVCFNDETRRPWCMFIQGNS